MSRLKTLRDGLGWSQPEMAKYLGVSQPTVSRMERENRESGPVKKILDGLEKDQLVHVEDFGARKSSMTNGEAA